MTVIDNSNSSVRREAAGGFAAGRWWLLFGLWLLYGSFGLIVTSMAPLVIPIESDLNMSHTAMGSIMGAWQLVYIFAAVPCGVLLDRIGGRNALLLGGLIIALSAAGRAMAQDYWGFLFAVMLFGIGGPIISSGAPKVVTQLFAGSQRGLAMGIYMTGPAIGGVISLTLTNALLMPAFDMQWRAVMWLWAGCALAAALIWWLLATIMRLDADRPAEGAASPPQMQIMGELLREPAVRIVLLMSVGVFLFNHGLNNWLPELLRSGGKSVVQAGYWAALPTVIGIFGSLLIPRLATPARRFNILIALALAALAASVLLHSLDNTWLGLGLFLQGVARSSLMTVLILTLVELPGIGEQRAGVASGLFFSAAEVGGMLGPLGMGLMYETTGGFGSALGFLSVVSMLMIVGALGLRRLSANAG